MSLQEKPLSFMILQEKQFPSFIVLTVTPACFYSLWFVGDFAGETCLFPSFLILQVKPALLYSLGFCSWNLPGYRLLDFANETCLFLSFMILQVKSAWLYILWDFAGETCLVIDFWMLQVKPACFYPLGVCRRNLFLSSIVSNKTPHLKPVVIVHPPPILAVKISEVGHVQVYSIVQERSFSYFTQIIPTCIFVLKSRVGIYFSKHQNTHTHFPLLYILTFWKTTWMNMFFRKSAFN